MKTKILLSIVLFASSCFAIITNIDTRTTFSTMQSAVSAAISGETLLVSTGRYTYMGVNSKNLTIIGGYTPDFSAQVSYSATILDGGSYCATFSISTSVVEGLTFTDASFGIQLNSRSVVTARHCYVENNINNNYGAGVRIISSSMLILDHTDISNNSATNAIGAGNGGGAYVGGQSKLIVSEYSHIRNNYAQEKGGGVYVASSGYVEIKNSSFISDNFADEAGGGVYLNGGDLYVHNNADIGYVMGDPNATPGDGGGIYAKNSSIIFENNGSSLLNNYAGNNGGGIFLTNSYLTFCNGSDIGYAGFSKTNYAGNSGGGIYALHSTVAMTNADVLACYAEDHGGAICAEESDVILYNCNFGHTNDIYTNVSRKDGGAIRVDSGTLFISGSSFFNNRAEDDGGVMRVDYSDVIITNSVFRNNIADDRAGALYFLNGYNVVEINDTSIITNIAGGDGGGIWCSYRNLIVRGESAINANEAGDDGGGIYSSGSETVLLGDVEMLNNKVGDDDGSRIYSVGSGLILLDDIEILNNKAVDDGGGIFSSGDQPFKIVDCDIRFNEADSDGNNNGNGGGLVVRNRAELEIIAQNKNVFISTNQALNGAGIFIENEFSSVDIVSTSGYQIAMLSNMASGDGGAICAVDSSETTIIGDVQISQCNAVNGGGIFAAEIAQVILEKSKNYLPQIKNCTARQSGGAISIVDFDTFVICDGVNFGGENDGNVSQGTDNGDGGGAVAVLNGAEFYAVDCAFEKNESAGAGGAIYVSNATAIVSGEVAGDYAAQLPSSVFINNFTSGSGGSYGGAIYVDNGYAELYNTAIISNNAQRGGGAYAFYSEIYFENVLLSKNNASLLSGADAVKAFGGTANIRFNYCTIAYNNRNGVLVDSGAELNMRNCIVWGHTALNVTTNPLQNVVFSDIQGGYPGLGNINRAPLFADLPNLDYQLTANSPCTNMATNIGITNDCIGVARPQLGGFDMGCYEFIPEPLGIWIIGLLEIWIIGRKFKL